MRLAASRTLCTVGKSRAISTATMAITTRSSTKLKALRLTMLPFRARLSRLRLYLQTLSLHRRLAAARKRATRIGLDPKTHRFALVRQQLGRQEFRAAHEFRLL